MRGSWKRTAAPSVEPITATQAKLYCKVDTSADDTLFTSLIQSARELIEDVTGRALIQQTYQYSFDCFPYTPLYSYRDYVETLYPVGGAQSLQLPIAPVMAVNFVKSYDVAGTVSTFGTANYYVDTFSEPGRIYLNDSCDWPAPVLGLRAFAAGLVEFTAGYGTTAATVPAALVQAIYALVAHWYENREAAIGISNMVTTPLGFDALITPYVVRH